MKNIYISFKTEMQKSNKSFSPSAFKPQLVVDDWLNHFGDKISVSSFSAINKEDLYLVHEKKYVDDIFSGKVVNGFGIKDSNFASTFLQTNGSLYDAANNALTDGIAISPTSGFHHARFDRAEGFCTFNGLILTAMRIKEKAPIVGILDFDMHYGNGTSELIKKHNLQHVIHYTAGKYYDLHYPALNIFKPIIKFFYNFLFTKSKKEITPVPKLRQKILKGKGEKFIKEIPIILDKFKKCNLIIYQAGADQHINDPYGGLLTYKQMIIRDKTVFEFAKDNGIPLVWNLAGGYQKDNKGTIEPVLKCHRNTMQECINVYCK